MKKILLLITSIILFQSCATTSTRELLHPNDKPIDIKLKSLIIGSGDVSVVRNEIDKTITVPTYIATIFEREMEQNVLESTREKYGYIELKLIHSENSLAKGTIYNKFYIVTNTIFLGIPIVYFGMPSKKVMEMEFELTIYDKNNNKIKSYIGYKEHKYMSNMWQKKSNYIIEQIPLEITKEVIEKFKESISNDIDYLNKELVEIGPIVYP